MSRPVISNDGALAWYEKNINIEPSRAGRLFNNRVLLLKRKYKTGHLMIGYRDFFHYVNKRQNVFKRPWWQNKTCICSRPQQG